MALGDDRHRGRAGAADGDGASDCCPAGGGRRPCLTVHPPESRTRVGRGPRGGGIGAAEAEEAAEDGCGEGAGAG